MAKTELGFRQIHLDFHTGPRVPGVGSRFDAKAFGEMAKRANVDSITVFAKCHHGHLYFATDHPARHPSLKPGLDLLGEQIEALHARGIRAPVYISVQCDEFAANTHPDWIARNADGTNVGAGPLKPGWQILDMASPYLDYLREQVAQVLERFSPVDGIFFDMCWNQPSVSQWAKARMLSQGCDPANEADRNAYAADLATEYMRSLFAQVRKASPRAAVYFNSRPLSLLREDNPYLSHVEVEALPTGGWGYMYFPMHVRYVRTFGRPYLGMTARFHKSWADFGGLKPEPALKYEICQMLAHGASCSIGDQMHPRGLFDAPAWERIGRVYDYAGQCRPWCQGAASAADVAVFRGEGGGYHVQSGGSLEGAVRMLGQLRQQFDVVDALSDLDKYRLLVLPDELAVDVALAKRLDKFIAGGGAVLATGRSGLAADGRPTWKKLPIVGAAEDSPYEVTYFRPGQGTLSLEGEGEGMPAMDHVLYGRGLRVRPAAGSEVLAGVVEPYFDRDWRHFCSHNQTPPDKLTAYPAAMVRGRVGYIAYPIFRLFATHGLAAYRQLVGGCIERLMGRSIVETSGPVTMEVSLMRQARRHVLHLLYYPAGRVARDLDLIEDTIPLHDVKVSVKLDKRPRRAVLAPQGQAAEFTWKAGRAELTVPCVNGHQMVVFEA